MKMLVTAAILALMTAPALAQSSTTGSQSQQANQSPQTNAQSSQQGLVAAQKIKQALQREGFTDVNVVAESFVVQGKSPDGNPVVMTIGPHGMSVFEAANANGSSSGTVGSNSHPQSGAKSSSTNSSK